jgi:signal transduction histidine kinase
MKAIRECRVVNVPDMLASDFDEGTKARARAGNYRAGLCVPMIRNGLAIGGIAVTRRDAGAFADHHVALLNTFADQAVIAIENVRLFNETKEALERQTATAEILKVIASSPSDVQPVFDAIVASALRLMRGATAHVTRLEGGQLHLVGYSKTDEKGVEALKQAYPVTVEPGSRVAETLVSQVPRIVTDVDADPHISEKSRVAMRARGVRSNVIMPMSLKGASIGTLVVNRSHTGGFTRHEIDLLKTFADQAVIAIENVRLFNETKEALERQTATAEILKVISSSPTDTQPVFRAIVTAGARLFEGYSVGINIADAQGRVHLGACEGPNRAELERYFSDNDIRASALVLKGNVVQFPDIEHGENVPEAVRAGVHIWGGKAIVYAPMRSGGKGVGAIWITRSTPGKFSDRETSLLRTFADQAVIAIDNVRLFRELQQRIGQMTALGEVGRAIGSTLDLETVLKTIVTHAIKLSGLDAGAIYEYDEVREEFRLRAAEGMAGETEEILRSEPIRKGEGAVGGTAVTREPVQVPDIQAVGYDSRLRDILLRAGRRAILAVPLLHDEHIVGALGVQKTAPGAFAPEVVELLKTFATQSAMAIQNARLYREIADKGKQLEIASQHKSQFLASMSHELRTPLNAILGFNEMVLDEVYGALPEDVRPPLQNMQTSGKHLLRLINNVLDLAKIEAGKMELALADYAVQDAVTSVHQTLLPLAAEKGLELVADVPAEIPLAFGDGGRITQCLMNLAGNSLKFTKQGQVTIKVGQENGTLRYSIVDTGIGIPPDKIGSLFTEFKQTDATIASEYGGTGLGLSISKKFVEMHGGRIWVESEIGKGSAFIFEIPLRVNS